MPLNPDAVGATSEPAEFSWTSKDALLYAVSIGAGEDELAFTTENTAGVDQVVFPTFPVVMGYGAGRGVMSNIGKFNPAMLVHGQQAVTLARPIPPEGTATLTSRLTDMFDKGKAAVVVTVNDVTMDGEPLYSTRMSAFIRGEGGWGGDRGPSGPQNEPPDREPDKTVTYQTSPDQAFLYRLNGDRNPLHTDPAVRRRRRVRQADPARAVQLRLHRPRPPAPPVRRRPGAVPPHRGTLRVAGPAGRGAHDQGVGDGARRSRVHDVGRRSGRDRPGLAQVRLIPPRRRGVDRWAKIDLWRTWGGSGA